MDYAPDLPVVGVCIVSDPTKCPPNYILIDKTYDNADADLWKDGLFGRRITRYLCIERCVPIQNQDVLTDVCTINDRDNVPPGFVVISTTNDTNERAVKKKILCMRWMSHVMTQDAITELIFLSKGGKKPPAGYTLVGELNGLALCYKMGRISRSASQNNLQQSEAPPYPMNASMSGGVNNMHLLGNSLPYAVHPTNAPSYNSPVTKPEQPTNTLNSSSVTPLSGIPWQLNPMLNSLTKLQNITIPEIRYKSLLDIETQFDYDFNLERSATNRGGS